MDHSLLVTVGRRCCSERLTEIALGSGDLTYDSTKPFELREHAVTRSRSALVLFVYSAFVATRSASANDYLLLLSGKLTPGPKKHSFERIFPSFNLKYSVFRNTLPSFVQPL